MISVKLPDGSTAQFPDGTPKEVMQAAIAKKFPPKGVMATAPSGQSAIPAQPQQAAPSPSLLDSTMATINGLTSSVPFLQQASDALIAGGQTAWDAATGQPVDFGARYGANRKVHEDAAAKAPLANLAGELAGSVGLFGGLGATKIGADALGLTGSFGKQLLNSGLSSAGYSGLQSLANGKQGTEVLSDMGTGGLGGLAGSVIGQGLSAAGQKIASGMTKSMQRGATSKAIVGSPTASELKSAASEMFDSATGGQPLMVSDTAYFRLLGSIKQVADKFRINAQNDPKATGLLETLMRIADDTANGTRVDIKDLHLIRQLAGKVAQSSEGRDKAFGSMVINQMDDFIRGLKSSDILGGANPSEAGRNLMTGISTWSRANRVQAIEDAIARADTYKSGYENGLKLSFLALMKQPIYKQFTEAEKRAIEDVAKGTTKQNIAGLFGKLGISFGGSSAHNILGSGVGTTGLTAALSPILGPAALPAAFATTTAAGMIGRNVAERAAAENAARAVGAVATPNVPIVKQVPNLLAPARVPIELLIRGGAAQPSYR